MKGVCGKKGVGIGRGVTLSPPPLNPSSLPPSPPRELTRGMPPSLPPSLPPGEKATSSPTHFLMVLTHTYRVNNGHAISSNSGKHRGVSNKRTSAKKDVSALKLLELKDRK